MKQYLVVILLIALNSIDCTEIKCASKLTKDACYLESSEYYGESKQLTVYVKACPSGQRCKRKEDSNFGYCLPILTLQKEGESCVYDFECEVGKCKDNKCQGFTAGTPCSRDADCNYETYCSKTERVCKKIIEKDQPCEMSFDRGSFESCFSYCELGYLCGKVGDDTEPKCHKAFSYGQGNITNNDNLCESGITKNGTCVSISVKTDSCSTSGTCEIEYNNGTSVVGTERCNEYVDRTKTCPDFDTSDLWKKYIEKYNKALGKVDVKKTNMKGLNRILLNNNDLVEPAVRYYEQEKIKRESNTKDEKCYHELYFSLYKQ